MRFPHRVKALYERRVLLLEEDVLMDLVAVHNHAGLEGACRYVLFQRMVLEVEFALYRPRSVVAISLLANESGYGSRADRVAA